MILLEFVTVKRKMRNGSGRVVQAGSTIWHKRMAERSGLMFQYKQTNKKTGITYLFEQESYWDSDRKQSRCRRTCLGKYNEKGELIPVGKRGRPSKTTEEKRAPSSDLTKLTSELEASKKTIRELERTIQRMQKEAEAFQKEKEARNLEIKRIIQSLQKLL